MSDIFGVGGAVQGAASIGAAALQASAAEKAASLQAASADKATQLQSDIYQQNRTDLSPWREKGASALSMLADSLGISGPEGNARAKDAFQTSPGYDFAFNEGKRGVEGSLAAKSMSKSGAAAKALTRYGQGTADTEYGGWLSRLGQLAGFGTAANQTGTNAATAFAKGASSTMQDAAAARASGYAGVSDAFSGGLNSLGKLAGNASGGRTSGGGSDLFSYGSGTGAPGSWSDFGYAY